MAGRVFPVEVGYLQRCQAGTARPEAQEAHMQESTAQLKELAQHFSREVRNLPDGEARKSARRELAQVERELRARGAL